MQRFAGVKEVVLFFRRDALQFADMPDNMMIQRTGNSCISLHCGLTLLIHTSSTQLLVMLILLMYIMFYVIFRKLG